ncbi:DUF6894 family protein [Bradyrhizobium sp. 44]|uniref:DUF6894 family protein n=1 Tax=Bradyrhizobium sp. 44 TaxID=2782675 RepID=UPI00387EAEC9
MAPSSRLIAETSQATGPALAGTSDDHPTAGGYITYLAGRRSAALSKREAPIRRSSSLLSRFLHVCHWKQALRQPTRSGMRYFFHIVDKYGLSPDGTGHEHSDQDAAVLHARCIAAELAKAGEFFREGLILVAAAPGAADAVIPK